MTMAILRAAALSSHLQLAVLLVLLSALPPTRAATPAAGNALASYTDYATQLHADLLANYNKAVPPKSKRTVAYSAAGTDVSLQLRFFKVESVTPAAGQMRTKLWWRTWWSDERLSWDPSQYGGVTELKFHASSYTDPETSDIWLPDLTIYNSLDAFHVSLEPAWASVRHDGTVFWTRPGLVSLMCRFSGLVMFPYDKLSCPLDVGGWQLSGTHQGLTGGTPSGGPCVTLEAPEEVSQDSYQEYQIVHVDCKGEVLEYSTAPGEFWPIVRFRIYLSRSYSYYAYFALFPSIVLTLLSFSVFFMSFQVLLGFLHPSISRASAMHQPSISHA